MAGTTNAPPVVASLPPISSSHLSTCAVTTSAPLAIPLVVLPVATSAYAANILLTDDTLRSETYTNESLKKGHVHLCTFHIREKAVVPNSQEEPHKNTAADLYRREFCSKPECQDIDYRRVQRGFGTKTAYIQPAYHHHTEVKSPYSCGGGSIIHVSLLARHGTRNPTRGHLGRLRKLETFFHEQLRNRTDYPEIKPSWLLEFSERLEEWEKGPGALAEEGVSELRQIGQRFRERYHLHLASQPVRVRSSYKDRAIASAEAFLEGYGEESLKSELDILQNGKHDSSLRFYDEEWNERYAKYVAIHKKEMKKTPYGEDRKTQQIAEKVAKGLGFDVTFKDDYLRRLVEYCAIERAQNRKPMSELSSKFSAEDLLYLERFEKRYTPFFNGHKLFDTLAAPLVEDLRASLRGSSLRYGSSSCGSSTESVESAKEEEEDHVGADLRFAHAETLIPLLLLLGVPGIDGSNDLMFLSPFAGNIMLELWAPPKHGPNSQDDFRVRFRLHERYVERIESVDGGEEGWLKLDVLLDFFETVVQKAQ